MAEDRIGAYELLASLQVVDAMQRFRARRVGDLQEVELRVSREDYLAADEWSAVAAQWQEFLRFHHPHVQQLLDFGISEERRHRRLTHRCLRDAVGRPRAARAHRWPPRATLRTL